MLGETRLPASTRSVFEYLSQKDRERLQGFRTARAEGAIAPTPASAPHPSSPGPPSPQPGGLHIPRLHPSVAKAALSGFQPFTTDPFKQARYTAFLTFQADPATEGSENLGFGPLPGHSTEEFNKELQDYAKSATVFKPLSGAMAGRFRSAVVVEMGPKVVEGLHQPTSFADDTAGGEEGAGGKQEEEEDPKMSAVRMGMYGPLTRTVTPWQPARLLCKRFGVKDPEVDLTAQAGEASADFEFATGEARRDAGPSGSGSAVPAMITAGTEGGEDQQEEQKSTGPRNLANVGLGEDETQGRDTLTYQRPAMDVFKAIFASDDEDSDDEDEDEGRDRENESTPAPSAPLTAVTSQADARDEPVVPPPPPNAAAEKVDLATFKPTFVPRADRESRKAKGVEKSKDNKKKDREKKKAKAVLMSFDIEDDGGIPSFGPAVSHGEKKKRERDKDKDKDGEKRKKKRKEKQDKDEDDSMWVEKPAPEVVKSLPIAPSPVDAGAVERGENGKEAGPARGRKRAIDFM